MSNLILRDVFVAHEAEISLCVKLAQGGSVEYWNHSKPVTIGRFTYIAMVSANNNVKFLKKLSKKISEELSDVALFFQEYKSVLTNFSAKTKNFDLIHKANDNSVRLASVKMHSWRT